MLAEHDMGRNFVKGIVDGINKNNKKTIVEKFSCIHPTSS
jgi:hypothetical protein